MMQDVLAIGTVLCALAWVLHHLVIGPALRARGPDVPVKNLVRHKKKPAAPSGDCCS
ncbi:MAG TPA: hypothetical protein VL400_19360 [Polyangiaceae bacterium]|nr:hypothetical protein [Polyangiaceae bacterium]